MTTQPIIGVLISCGVSIQHLTPSQSVHPIITSNKISSIFHCWKIGERISDIWREFGAKELYRNIYHQRRGVYQFIEETYRNDYQQFYENRNLVFKPIYSQFLDLKLKCDCVFK